MKPSWKLCWLLTGVLFGCAGAGAGGDLDDPTGRGDDLADECPEYGKWLMLEFAPMTCDDGPSCIGQVSPETAPACSARGAYSFWHQAFAQHLWNPLYRRYLDAKVQFMMTDSPVYGDHDHFVATITPTAEEWRAFESLQAVQPQVASTFDYSFEWTASYETFVLEMASPLQTQSLVGLEFDGRRICGDPLWVVDEWALDCQQESALMLNSGELAIFDLLDAAAPAGASDGRYAAWIEIYYWYLTQASDLAWFDFPIYTGRGLATYELAFFARLRQSRPAAIGDDDSRSWLGYYDALMAGLDPSLSDLELRVDLWEDARPSQLVGAAAYKTWLGRMDLDEVVYIGGIVDYVGDPAKYPRFAAAEPCARDQSELEAFLSIYRDADLATGLSAAGIPLPHVCP